MARSGMVEGPIPARDENQSDRPLQVAEHLARRNAEGFEPSLRQPLGTPLVALRLIPHRMNLAIDFDRQPALETGEVEHETSHRELPPKAEFTRPLPKLLPKQHFRQGHAPAQVASETDVAVRCADCPVLHPRAVGPSTALRAVPLPVPGRN
jgi:hypothetical protein